MTHRWGQLVRIACLLGLGEFIRRQTSLIATEYTVLLFLAALLHAKAKNA
ncbi:MAG: hypothetical protein HC862_01115 [Scytonema sp. RU_4_4]|nr:hypothetical protein [Scytonema sp. RU_4_4]